MKQTLVWICAAIIFLAACATSTPIAIGTLAAVLPRAPIGRSALAFAALTSWRIAARCIAARSAVAVVGGAGFARWRCRRFGVGNGGGT